MAVDPLELRLVSAFQRFQALQRQADTHSGHGTPLTRALAELGTALEDLRLGQERILEHRHRIEELQAQLRDQQAKYWELFDEMPDPAVVTKPDTTILEVNRAAVNLFNVSQRYLVGKTLSVFVCENRAHFVEESGRIAQKQDSTDLQLKLRPRERAPLAVRVRVRGDGARLRWILRAPARNPATNPSQGAS
jgi:PAS domain S-box-containing protein